MSLSVRLNDRRVKKAITPVYEKLSAYADALELLEQQIEHAEDFNLVATTINDLPAPTTFLSGSLRVKKAKPHPLPARRKAREQLHLATAYLNVLHFRLRAEDLERELSTTKNSALLAHTRYLRVCVQAMMKCVDPRTFRSHGVTAGRAMFVLCRQVAVRANEFRCLTEAAVESFDEPSYLELNEDVANAIRDGKIHSGYEHLARSGLREVQLGLRNRIAFNVHDITLADAVQINDPKLAQSRDVIRACGCFDELWYRLSCPHHLSHTQNALDHYVAVGERLGCMPNERFDPGWYRQHYQLDDSVDNAFAHYLAIGRRARLKPNAVTDPVYYVTRYGSSFRADTDIVDHYYDVGTVNGWRPSAEFNARQYREREMDEADVTNPVTHFRRQLSVTDTAVYGDKDTTAYLDTKPVVPTLAMAVSQAGPRSVAYENAIKDNTSSIERAQRKATKIKNHCQQVGRRVTSASLGLTRKVGASTAMGVKKSARALVSGTSRTKHNPVRSGSSVVDVASQIMHFANPGPGFEEPSTVDTTHVAAKARTIAFFLPQFYPFDRNDEWWGKGFTEWRNVARGTPRFEDHYQPRIPRDLGFYDLTNVDTLKAQSELAKKAGIEAFCFYYYWFNGERLMDKPLDLFAEADIDQDFCIMWANENWTRTWDGFEGQVLIQQDYRDEDEDAFIADTARYFNHPRYTLVNDKPLFILYRPGLLPDAEATIARWKQKWELVCGVEPHVLMVQGFGDEDPTAYNLDGAVEFPPHKLCVDIPDINSTLNVIDPNYTGHARDYNAVIEASLSETPPDFPLIKTVSPHWDNDARRESRGMTLHGSTPENYERWLRGAVNFAHENPFEGDAIVFINAWNEWAEGAYLEPDVHYGHAYLNATQRAVYGLVAEDKRHSILLVGHDAHRHGAQLLLKSIAQTCSQQFGMKVVIALKGGGPMVPEYGEIAETVVLEGLGTDALSHLVKEHRIASAICNTSVTGDLVPLLKREAVSVVSLIHELPNLISEYGLENHLKDISRSADHVVFPAAMVEAGFNQFASTGSAMHHIRPQGNYKIVEFDAESRAAVRAQLGIHADERLVLNVGYADLRKGFDLFLQTAKQIISERDDVHFVWLGNRAKDIDLWLTSDLDETLLQRLHLVDFTDDVNAYYSASDALYLSSREDPYPTVVLEAMAIGMPVVLHEGTTGFDELVGQFGYCVPKNRPAITMATLLEALFEDSAEEKEIRKRYVNEACQFDDYCFDLLQMAQPALKKVSVVVPNYNYEQYMSSRLNSVFEQDYPIFETIVLDDCSSDGSVARIQDVVKQANRSIRFSPNVTNSGNTFKQWKKGMSMVRGDLVWIAEADDWASPTFVSGSVASHTDTTALSFTDSVQIDTECAVLAESYDYYYNEVDASLFRSSFTMPGDEFVARAMAVRNVIMNVSSVLWNRDDLEEGLEALGDELTEYNLVGDWRLYLQALLTPGRDVAYINQSLNTHRRHPESVTHALDYKKHLAEIQLMHQVVLNESSFNAADREAIQAQLDDYVAELRIQFGVDESIEEDVRLAA